MGQVVSSGNNDLQIVGVAEDVHAESVEGENGWQIYYPLSQTNAGPAKLVIRTTLPPATLAGSVLSALRELNPKQTAAEFMPLQSFVDHANSPRRFFMLLVISFAGTRAPASGSRYLRRHLILGYEANAGDRYSHGVGS